MLVEIKEYGDSVDNPIPANIYYPDLVIRKGNFDSEHSKIFRKQKNGNYWHNVLLDIDDLPYSGWRGITESTTAPTDIKRLWNDNSKTGNSYEGIKVYVDSQMGWQPICNLKQIIEQIVDAKLGN